MSHEIGSSGSHIMMLDTELTLDLIKEGYSNDIISHIQDVRKRIGCDIKDHVEIHLLGDVAFSTLGEENMARIYRETLSQPIPKKEPPFWYRIDDSFKNFEFPTEVYGYVRNKETKEFELKWEEVILNIYIRKCETEKK